MDGVSDSYGEYYDLGVANGSFRLENQSITDIESYAKTYKITITEPFWGVLSVSGNYESATINGEDVCDYYQFFGEQGEFFIEITGAEDSDFAINFEAPVALGTFSVSNDTTTIVSAAHPGYVTGLDVYQITLSEDSSLSVKENHDCFITGGQLDVGGYVYDSNGDEVGDEGSLFLEAGTYYFNAVNFDYDYVGNYDFDIVVSGSDHLEENDSIETAYDLNEISEEVQLTALSITPGTDVDYFKFSLSEETNLSIYTSGESFFDTILTVYNESGEEIAYNDDGYEGNFSLVSDTFAAGTYYVKVESYDYASGRYNLTIGFDEPGEVAFGANATDLGTLTESISLTDIKTTSYDGNWYKFTVADAERVVISDLGSFDDERYIIYDANGEWCEGFVLQAGDYYFCVGQEYGAGYLFDVNIVLAEDLGTITETVSVEGERVGYSKYYKFTIAEDGVLDVNIIDNGEGEDQYYLYDSNGEEVYIDGLTILTAGTYFVSVYDEFYNGYTLELESAVDLGTVTETVTVEGESDGYGYSKYYKFTIAEDGVWDVNIITDAWEPGVEYYLYDSNGEEVYIDGLTILTAGTYFVSVKSYDEYNTGYTLELESAVDLGVVSDGQVFEDQLLDDSSEVFKFTWLEDAACNIKVGDEYFYLYDASGEEISLAEGEVLAAGTYYISVSRDSSSRRLVSVSFNETAESDSCEENDSIETAYDLNEITEEVQLTDLSIAPGTDVDYFKFSLSEETNLSIYTSGESSLDTALFVYNEDGEQIVYCDDNDCDPFELISDTFAAGTYYVKVESNNYGSNQHRESCRYNLTIGFDEPGEDNTFGANATDLGTLTESISLTDVKTTSYAGNWYKFTVADAERVVVSDLGSFDDEVYTIYDANGEYYDGSFLQAGDYYFCVGQEYGTGYLFDVNIVLSEDLGTVTETVTVEGESDGYDYSKYYKFTIAEGGWDVNIITDAWDDDVYYCLYDSNGEEIYVDGLTILTAGTYFVSVESYVECNTGYTLELESAIDLGVVSDGQVFEDQLLDDSKEVFKFTWQEDAACNIKVGDEYFYLYDASGEEIYLEEGEVLAAGTYYISVSRESSRSCLVSVSFNETDSHEENDSIETAYDLNEITEEVQLTDLSIAPGTDVDYFKFSLSEETNLSIYTSGESSLDTILTVYNESGEKIAYNDDGGEGHFSLISDTFAAGTYYVKVESYDYASGSYNLTIGFDEPGEDNTFAANATDLGTLTESISLTDIKTTSYAGNWYKFTVADAEVCRVEFDGFDENTLTIYDATGEYCEDFVLQAGDYYFCVGQEYGTGYLFDVNIVLAEDLGTVTETVTVEGESDGYGYSKYYKFTIAEDGVWDVNIITDASWDDSVYYNLYDSNGEEVYIDGLAILTAGTYFVSVKSYDEYNTSYTLELESAEDLGTVTETVTVEGESDGYEYSKYYKFTIAEDGVWDINITSEVSGNYVEYNLYDSNGEEVYIDGLTILTAGTYFVSVCDDDNYGYTLELESAVDLGVVSGNQNFDEHIFNDGSGVFKFSVSEDTPYLISINDGNVEYYLRDANFEDIYDSVLEAGTYYLYVQNDYDIKSFFNVSINTAEDLGVLDDEILLENQNVTCNYYKITMAEEGTVIIKENSGDLSFIVYDSSFGEVEWRGNQLAAGDYYIEVYSAHESNVNDASFTVMLMDTVAPDAPVITQSVAGTNQDWIVYAQFSSDTSLKEYSYDGDLWMIYDNGITVSENTTLYFRARDAYDNISEIVTYTAKAQNVIPQNLKSSEDGELSWDAVPGATGYVVEYSQDNFETFASITTQSNKIDTFALPAGTCQWRVKAVNCGIDSAVSTVTSTGSSGAQIVASDADGNMDVFFAGSNGTWEAGYSAEHFGDQIWNGTNEQVSLAGKNKLTNVWNGSVDANVMLMSDSSNGDALFLDDIYSALGSHARISQIQEIRAGAGNDIIDITSRRYAYDGYGMTVYGGNGDDVIWANKGSNTLFGDAGNDRVVGGSGNDIVIGGSGNDSMHGGGGNDIFCFGDSWGVDAVAQLSAGEVTLWFENGSESNWDSSTMTYRDGSNSVSVSGVSEVTLKFGDDGSQLYIDLVSAGCFLDSASEKIFEDKNNGMLA